MYFEIVLERSQFSGVAMPEDVNDKLRRNVVAISFLALLSCVFPLEWSPDAKIFGLFQIKKIDPTLAWASVLIVLAYFYCRYFYNEDTQKNRIKTRNEYTTLKEARILAMLQAQVNHAIRTRIWSASVDRQSILSTVPYSQSFADRFCAWSLLALAKELSPESNCQIRSVQLSELIQANSESEGANLIQTSALVIEKSNPPKSSWDGVFSFNIKLKFLDDDDIFSLPKDSSVRLNSE